MTTATALAPANAAAADHFQLAAGVFAPRYEGVLRLLDFENSNFYGLDEIGSHMLSLVLEHGEHRAASMVAVEFNVAISQARADVHDLVQSLEQKGLLVRPSAAASGRSRGWRRWLLDPVLAILDGGRRLFGRRREVSPRRVRRLLRQAWLSLRLLGWSGSVQRWRCTAPAAQLTAAQAADVVDDVDRLVRQEAAHGFLMPAACKERALAAFHLLSAHGIPATLVVGVQHYPFLAHAWVTVAGRVITDDAEHCERFLAVAHYESTGD